MLDGLRFRLTLIFVGLAVGPLILVGVAIGQRSFRSLEQQSLALQHQIAANVGGEVRAFIERRENELVLLDAVYRLGVLDRIEQQRILGSLLMYQQVYQEFTLLGSEGQEQFRLSRFQVFFDDQLEDRSQDEAFRFPITQERVYFGPLYFDESTREPLIALSVPLFDQRSGKVVSVLLADLRFKPVWNLLADIQVPDQGEVYIVDWTGRVIAHKNPSIVLRGTTVDLPEADGRAEGLSGADVFIARDVLQLGNQELIIVAEQPVSDALELATDTLRVAALVTSIVLVVAAALVVLATNRFVRPIEALAASAQAISSGDFSRRVQVHGRDEVGQLALAFSQMARGLEESRKQIARYTQDLEIKNEQLQRDIAARLQAEEEVLRLQHLLQNITDSMPSALITLDLDGRVLTWNPAAETLTNRTVGQVQGQSLWQTCPELSRYRELFEEVLQQRQVAHRHKERVTAETGPVYRDVSVFPLETNEVDGAVLRIDDVTRRVQLEEMMLQSAKLASVGGLAAGVAHEINNPLGAMMQSAQVVQMALDTQSPRTRERLRANGVDPDQLERYLQERGIPAYLDGTRAAGGRAAKIMSDLLSFSRKPSSKVAPRNLNALVEQTLELAATDYDLKKKYDFRNLEVVREYAADLPEVMCDGQQIQQVVLNLVRNAAQAMAEHVGKGDREYRPRLTLRTSLALGSSSLAHSVRLEVEDNGPGIPEAVRERMFEPFFTTKEVGEGTGLGLWLCWSIVVERHGGQIWAEPVEEGGTRFVVELPVEG